MEREFKKWCEFNLMYVGKGIYIYILIDGQMVSKRNRTQDLYCSIMVLITDMFFYDIIDILRLPYSIIYITST